MLLCNAGAHNFSFFQQTSTNTNWDQYILLDNQSTCHILKNKSLLKNIQLANSPIAIHSTAGVTYADTIGHIPNFLDPGSSVYVCKEGIANILSFTKVWAAGCAITYNHNTDAFIVKEPSHNVIFNRLPSGLYGHHVLPAGVCLVETVDSLAKGYSPWQIALANKAAWKAMSMMGSQSLAALKLMVQDNLINNRPVTLKAIKLQAMFLGLMLHPYWGRWSGKHLSMWIPHVLRFL